MPLGSFHAERFRCLAAVELELDPGANLFIGPNASGKTSLLEAAFFLSRGRSFRSRRREALIAHGEDSFLLTGKPSALPGPSGSESRQPAAARNGTSEVPWPRESRISPSSFPPKS
jgi:recombinational DNA repair ATPase RecF